MEVLPVQNLLFCFYAIPSAIFASHLQSLPQRYVSSGSKQSSGGLA